MLRRWAAEGLISEDQVARIAAAEGVAGHEASPAAGPDAESDAESAAEAGGLLAPGRVGYLVEALGYLGGTLAAVAGFVAVRRLWPDLPTAGELAFAAVGTVVLLAAGALLQAGRDPALDRLRGVLWALSTGCLTAFTALLADRVWDLSDDSTAPLAASAAALYAAGLWLRTRGPIEHLVLFTALAVAVGSGIARLDQNPTPWSSGLGIWLLSAAWAGLALRGLITPALMGQVTASAGLLMGAVLTMETGPGTGLALATVAGLLAGGVLLRKVWLLGVGAFGVLMVVPQAAARFLPESVAAPLAVFAVGLVLLGVAVRLARTRKP
jgi:hypothetical protein